jgi:steroid delta-isomerase-like uncharacterized protein
MQPIAPRNIWASHFETRAEWAGDNQVNREADEMTEFSEDRRQERRALIEEGFAAWNRHDAAGVAERFPEEARIRVVATGEAARGREQIRALVEARLQAFPDWHLEPQTTYACGEAVCVEWLLTGTQEGDFGDIPATRRSVELAGRSIFEFGPDGLITEERVYFDSATMLVQLGVLPDPADARSRA